MPSILAARPAPAVWSAMEYAAHSRDVTAAMGLLLHVALTEDAPVLDAVPGRSARSRKSRASMREAITQLDKNVARLNGRASKMTEAEWHRTVTAGDRDRGRGVDRRAMRCTTPRTTCATSGRGLHALGAGAPTQHGVVVQVSTSAGGVPKRALGRITIGTRGVAGDVQAERKHHGKPMQALSLWSTEVIDALRDRRSLGVPGRGRRERHAHRHRLVDDPAGRAGADRRRAAPRSRRSRRRARRTRSGSRIATSVASTTTAIPDGAARTRGCSTAARSSPATR